jgi:indole-3-glycerol phosphate synthase
MPPVPSSGVGTYLDTIVASHRAAADADERSLDELLDAAAAMARPRGFGDALRVGPKLRVIAEVKRRSPSKGDLHPDLDPAAVASDYERGGAACLSVLTDAEYFGGSPADLCSARAAVALPVLRKDFTVDARDLVDARLMGADAVLLIVAALDERELDVAVDAGASIIGVNQRDLTTFDIDRELAVKLATRMPDAVVSVAESGIRGVDDAVTIAAAGYDAVLVGESVVTSGDHAAAVAALAGVTC